MIVSLYSKTSSADPTRSCKWNISELPVYVNIDSFTARGYNEIEVKMAVVDAINNWYIEGGANFRPYFAGYTTDTQGRQNQLNVIMEDWVGISGRCDYGWATYGSGNCDSGNTYVVIFDKLWYNCPKRPLHWMDKRYPSSAYNSILNVLMHEFGHAFGGYSDDYSNPNTVMQGLSSIKGASVHLYNIDIYLLRDDPNYGYGRRSNRVVGRYSTNTTTWTPSTTIGYSYLRPAAATTPSSSNSYMVAYVNTHDFTIRYRIGNGGSSWQNEVPLTSTTKVGPALVKTPNYFVLAYSEAEDTRRIFVRRYNGSSWSSAVVVNNNARTQSPPALGYNSEEGKVILLWTDRDSDRLMYSISSDEGNTWSTPQQLGSDDDLEFYSYQGPSISCVSNADHCLLVWSTWGSYRNVMNNVCTAHVYINGSSLIFDHRRCGGPDSWGGSDKVIDSGRTPGIAYGSNSFFTGFIMARDGRNSDTYLNIHKRDNYDLQYEWSDPVIISESSKAGATVVFSGYFNEWEVFYITP